MSTPDVCVAAVQSSCPGTFHSTESCSTANCPLAGLDVQVTPSNPTDTSIPVGQASVVGFTVTVESASAKSAATTGRKVLRDVDCRQVQA